MKHTLERPVLANTTKTAKLQWFSINLFPLSARTFFSSLMASFCWEPQVYSRQKSGRWIVKGWIAAHCAIRLSSTSSSLAKAWRRNWRMEEWLRSLGECFLSPAMNSLKQRESKSHTRACSVFQTFFCPVITENYGYQVATFAALTISGCFQAQSDFEKLVMLLEISLKSDRYCWQVIGEGNTNLYAMTKWMKTH